MQWYKRLSRDKDKLSKSHRSSPHQRNHSEPLSQNPVSRNSTSSRPGTIASIATFGSVLPTTPIDPANIPPRTSSTGQPALTASASIPSPPLNSAYKLAQVPEAVSSASSASSSSNTTVSSFSQSRSPGASGRIRSVSQSLAYSHSRSQSHIGHIRPQRNSLGIEPPAPLVMSSPSRPQPDASRYATEDLDFYGKKSWTPEKDKVVSGPFDYLYGHPGKDFRSQLIKAFDVWLEVPEDSLAIITQVVGMLHTASLLIDDVEDSSSLRRGLPVAHNIYGVAQTINSANYIYFRALQEVQKLRSPNAIAVFGDELVHLHRGQGMDLFWRDSLACPTEEEYLEMVGNKTGGLFRLGVKLMQGESRSLVDCIPLVNLVGLIFQIRDDYLNLASTEYSDNKGLCEDLTEGKFSFPIIHAIRADPLNTQLLNILRQKTNDVDVKRYAVAYMESMGTFEYTRTVVNTLIERAKKVANEIDEGRGKTARVLAILDMMVLPEGKVRPGGRAAEGEKKEEAVQEKKEKEELQTPGTLKALEIMAGRQDMQKENLAKIVALARKEKEKEKEKESL